MLLADKPIRLDRISAMQADSHVQLYDHPHLPNANFEAVNGSVFLDGPTSRECIAEYNWRSDAVHYLRKQGFKGGNFRTRTWQVGHCPPRRFHREGVHSSLGVIPTPVGHLCGVLDSTQQARTSRTEHEPGVRDLARKTLAPTAKGMCAEAVHRLA